MDAERYVDAEARRTRRPKSQIIAALADEAVRTRRFPGVHFRGDDTARRAWIPRVSLEVWELVRLLRDYGSSRRVTDELGIPPEVFRLAEAYASAYRDEIEALLSQNRPSEDDVRALYPFAEIHLVAEE
jgi:hypothetical protein